MPNDINELDVNDIGLKGIFGKRFEDETEIKPEVNEAVDAYYESTSPKKTTKSASKVWSPFEAEPSFTQKLLDTAKRTGLFGALYLLFFYWQCTGQMQPSAAVPAMCVCAAMVGWSIGKNARKR